MSNPREHFELTVELALEGMADHLPDPFEAEKGGSIAEGLGYGIRLGISLEPRVRRWLEELSPGQLDQILDEALGILAGAVDATLSRAATARDRAESVRVAVLRSCVAKGGSPIEALARWGAFLDELARVDSALRARASRTEIEDALGEARCSLLCESDWTSQFETGAEDAGEQPEDLDLEGLEVPLGASPPDSVVAAYVENGEHAAWVEGVADRREEFARELASVIEAFREMDEPIGLVARRWEARKTSGAEVVPVPLGLAMAAATGSEATSNRIALGTLAPLSCVAVIVETREALELMVHPETESIASVELGPNRVESVHATGAWRVSIERTSDPVTMQVVTSDGRMFAATLQLTSPEPS